MRGRSDNGDLGRLQALTYVDQVVGIIVGQAARGRILPGGRINELQLSQELGISRAPIREALRVIGRTRPCRPTADIVLLEYENGSFRPAQIVEG